MIKGKKKNLEFLRKFKSLSSIEMLKKTSVNTETNNKFSDRLHCNGES